MKRSQPKLLIPFRFGRNARNVSYQLKKRNKTKQVSPRLKSRVDPEIPVKFQPEHSGRNPGVPFRVKAIESLFVSVSVSPFWSCFSLLGFFLLFLFSPSLFVSVSVSFVFGWLGDLLFRRQQTFLCWSPGRKPRNLSSFILCSHGFFLSLCS